MGDGQKRFISVPCSFSFFSQSLTVLFVAGCELSPCVRCSRGATTSSDNSSRIVAREPIASFDSLRRNTRARRAGSAATSTADWAARSAFAVPIPNAVSTWIVTPTLQGTFYWRTLKVSTSASLSATRDEGWLCRLGPLQRSMLAAMLASLWIPEGSLLMWFIFFIFYFHLPPLHSLRSGKHDLFRNSLVVPHYAFQFGNNPCYSMRTDVFAIKYF